ncbi:MYND-type domain-containing protein [Mycena kentingensis (nom. inval.)]|nr:MYND-type domain-containing protein [Mycena kentingensis (nom. inval.)]
MNMLQGLQSRPPPPGKPAFVKLARGDDGAGLLPAFFQHPDSYTKHVGGGGRIRSWGLYPYVFEDGDEDGYEDVAYQDIMMRKMKTQMIYGFGGPTRPEDQFLNAVMARKKTELKQAELGDLTRRDYVLRIHMPYIKTPDGEDRIWRRFVVSGGMSLGVLHDKVVAPLMGWVRNFHAHLFTDYRDGTIFGPKKSTSIDMMHVDLSGYVFLNEDDYCMAHLVQKVGQVFQYDYDFGDHFRHEVTVENILPLEESYGRVQILGGSGICPMENGNGNTSWAERLEKLAKSRQAERREVLSEIYSSPNYVDRGWSKRANFDPDYFDLAETTQAVMDALGTKLSYAPGAKRFTMPVHPMGMAGSMAMGGKKKTTREVTTAPGNEFGFYEELKKEGRDSRRATACAACGKPNDLKACSGCGQRFYCGQVCQKAHWKSTHKQECAKEKAKSASAA